MSLTHTSVTVGITSYNSEATIEDAVMSALHQTWPKLDVIIVDDASTDQSYNIVKTFEKKHENILAFQNIKNYGVAHSRNKIIKISKSDFIAFFDDDDVSDPSRIRQQVERIQNAEKMGLGTNLVICHTARRIIDRNGVTRIRKTMADRKFSMVTGPAVAQKIIIGSYLRNGIGECATSSQMARRESYIQVGYFDENFRRSEDTEFNVRFAKSGGCFVGISNALVTQKVTERKKAFRPTEIIYQDMLLRKHKDIACKHGMYDFCLQWNQLRHQYLVGETILFWLAFCRLAITHPMKLCVRISIMAFTYGQIIVHRFKND